MIISQNIPINAKFTILDAYNINNISNNVKYNDEIILRSSFGVYLILSHDSNISATGHIISEESIWKLIKPNVPYIPEWNFKRKFLNNNCNSYIFNLDSNNRTNDSKDLLLSASSKFNNKKKTSKIIFI